MSNLGSAQARDINEAGFVVGESGDPGRAFVWILAGGGFTPIQLGTLGGANDTSIAFAINDADPPEVVGESSLGPCNVTVILRGFRVVLDGMNMLDELPPVPAEDNVSSAADINTPDPVLIVGKSFSCDFRLGCLADQDGVHWDPVNNVVKLIDLGPPGVGARANGTNNNNEIVGWGIDPVGCSTAGPFRALYWPVPAAAPITLPMPAGQELEDSQANAINILGAAVGVNITSGDPLLWEPDGSGGFGAIDLQAAIAADSDACGWDLGEAHDINDNGWIVGVGQRLAGGEIRAYLLVPLGECEEDVNHDEAVNVLDLIDLLLAFGQPCPVGSICWKDVNADCAVDVLDLIDLLLEFGTVCPGGSAEEPRSLEEELEKAGLSEEDWEEFMDIMEEGTPEQQANYKCWMIHYLSECPNISCPPNCPGPDPFGGH